jgi:hypothetical protein
MHTLRCCPTSSNRRGRPSPQLYSQACKPTIIRPPTNLSQQAFVREQPKTPGKHSRFSPHPLNLAQPNPPHAYAPTSAQRGPHPKAPQALGDPCTPGTAVAAQVGGASSGANIGSAFLQPSDNPHPSPAPNTHNSLTPAPHPHPPPPTRLGVAPSPLTPGPSGPMRK